MAQSKIPLACTMWACKFEKSLAQSKVLLACTIWAYKFEKFLAQTKHPTGRYFVQFWCQLTMVIICMFTYVCSHIYISIPCKCENPLFHHLRFFGEKYCCLITFRFRWGFEWWGRCCLFCWRQLRWLKVTEQMKSWRVAITQCACNHYSENNKT